MACEPMPVNTLKDLDSEYTLKLLGQLLLNPAISCMDVSVSVASPNFS